MCFCCPCVVTTIQVGCYQFGGEEPNGWWTPDQVLNPVDVSSQVYMVTGAYAGLGFETARCLLKAGAQVIITARSREEARATTGRLIAGLEISRSRVKSVCIDFSVLSSVEVGVEEFLELGVTRLDVLCLSEEIDCPWKYTETEDGHEVGFQVNHLGQFYLFKLLLPTLKKFPGTKRVVFRSNFGALNWTPKDFNVDNHLPQIQDTYNWRHAYGYSILCNVLMAREISKRYAEQDIIAYSVHSGTTFGTSIFCCVPHFLYWVFRYILLCCYYAFCLCWTDLESLSTGTSTQLFIMTYNSEILKAGGLYADCKLQVDWARGFNINFAETDMESRKLWRFNESTIAAKNKKYN